MKLAVVGKYPPASEGISEYARHLVSSIAQRSEVDRIAVIANQIPERLCQATKRIEVRRVWRPDTPGIIQREGEPMPPTRSAQEPVGTADPPVPEDFLRQAKMRPPFVFNALH